MIEFPFSEWLPMVRARKVLGLVSGFALFFGFAAGGFDFEARAVQGQEPAGGQASVTPSGDDLAAAQQEYEQALTELRRLTKEATRARVAYQTGTREESDRHRRDWDAAMEAGERQRGVLEAAALRFISLSPKPSKELVELVNQIHGSYVLGGRWSKAAKVAEYLRVLLAEDDGFLSRDAVAAISSNQFAAAAKFRATYGHLISNMPKEAQQLYSTLPELQEKYNREQKFLDQDAAGEPLPRVVLKTTKGRIELELFENQAPDTVGNFIYLVESGFYTNHNFHRVISGFMAQTGGYGTDKLSRDPGYTIFDEFELAEARHHFQGYVSMANASVPQSASSQFFFTLVPTPHLDGKHTVFGRIISGQDVVESLVKTHEVNREGEEKEIPGVIPDYIISAEVIRKRDHEYKPRKAQ
jgi:cyclophilin family peptidyl-prolyl cis-trans isomerase